MSYRKVLLSAVLTFGVAVAGEVKVMEITGTDYPIGTKEVHHKMRTKLAPDNIEPAKLQRSLEDGWKFKQAHINNRGNHEHKFFSMQLGDKVVGDFNYVLKDYSEIRFADEAEAKKENVTSTIWRLAFNLDPDHEPTLIKAMLGYLKTKEPNSKQIYIFAPATLDKAGERLKKLEFSESSAEFDNSDSKIKFNGYVKNF